MPAETDRPRLPTMLWLFAAVNLGLGSAVFVIGGILEPIARDLGIGIPAAGQAMTAYALATAVLAPLLLLATGRWPRKRVLLLGLALFTAGGVVCAMASNLTLLLAGRVLMGMGSVFMPAAAAIAVALAPPERRGQALSLVFVGMSLSYLIGVPLGAWLGFGHGWRLPVALFAGASALALALVALCVPARIDAPGARFDGLGRLLARPEVLRVLGLTLVYFVAIFTVFSYIGPVLTALVPMDRGALSATLALFGAAGVAGTLIGGAANDRFGPGATLRVQLTLLASMMALLPFTAGHWLPMAAVLVVWGVAGFGMMAPQQSRLAALSPAQAPVLLSLNSSMLYLGTAAGAALGGAVLPWVGYGRLAWVASAGAFAGVALMWWGERAPPRPRASAAPDT